MDSVIEYTVKGGICRITLNRPDKRNALNFDLLDGLDNAFDKAEKDGGVRVIILQGNGPSFCSGYDNKGSYYFASSRDSMDDWGLESAVLNLRKIEARYMRIWNCPKPTIARVHGHALAAGCYLQMVCDISVAAEDAVLGHPAITRGGVSSMPLWQFLLGPKKARYLLFTGRTISGKEAESMGLVSLAIPADKLDETVDGIAADVAAIPHEGLFHNKETLNTDLEVMGLGTMFRYHGQMNSQFRYYKYRE